MFVYLVGDFECLVGGVDVGFFLFGDIEGGIVGWCSDGDW